MPLHIADTIDTDVLIIGGGGAGLRAAIEARRRGAAVLILSKSPVGYANNTAVALGRMAAATGGGNPQDGPDGHFRDTVLAGRFLNDQALVEMMTQGGRDVVADLSALGVEFARRDGKIEYSQVAGHSHPRTTGTKAGRGLGFTRPLKQSALDLGIRMEEGVLTTRLITSGGAISGAAAIDAKGAIRPYRAKAVVLAAGGLGQIYEHTDNAKGICGDGFSLAYEVGAPLRDMEFVQFERTFTDVPAALAISPEAILRNRLGQNIPEKHGLDTPMKMTRDAVSQAIMKDVKAGLGVDGCAIYDLSHLPPDRLERLAASTDRRIAHRIEAGERWFKTLPVVHFFMGGVVIDGRCATAIEGLYCAGEVAGGIHGANRLGSNALLDIFVFGRVAGAEAGQYVKRRALAGIPKDIATERARLEALTGPGTGEDVRALRLSLQRTMWQRCGILRNGDGLKEGLRELKNIRDNLAAARVESGPALARLVETRFMATTAEMILRAALMRTESRGAHYREDYPQEDNGRWLQNILVSRKGEEMSLALKPVALTSMAPEVAERR